MVSVKGLKRPGGEFGATGALRLSADTDDVFNFVCDVESQPSWHRGVKACEVLERSGNRKTVNQTLGWHFLALRGDMHFTLEQEEDAAAHAVTTRLVSGTLMRSFGSSVHVRPVAPGVCDLEMQMYMKPAIFVPPGVRPFVGRQVRKQLEAVLHSMEAALSSDASSQQSAPASARASREDLPSMLALPPPVAA